MDRERYHCNDLLLQNALVAELCGYPKLLEKVKKKWDANNRKRKCGKRILIKKNANKLMHGLS